MATLDRTPKLAFIQTSEIVLPVYRHSIGSERLCLELRKALEKKTRDLSAVSVPFYLDSTCKRARTCHSNKVFDPLAVRVNESLGKTVRKQYEKLTAWIRSMTLKQLLDWFDCVERVEVRNRVAQYRWSTETTARDQMFLELFFDESD